MKKYGFKKLYLNYLAKYMGDVIYICYKRNIPIGSYQQEYFAAKDTVQLSKKELKQLYKLTKKHLREKYNSNLDKIIIN